jgi:imidazolonepropionase-like amidohydrolase
LGDENTTHIRSILLRADWLFDGTGLPAVADAAVLVQHGRIQEIYKKPPSRSELPEGCETIELQGCTLLPGLIDCHVHLCLPGDGTPFTQAVSYPQGVIQAIAIRNASKALHVGVTTLRDCGGFPDVLHSLRRSIELGYAEGPRLVLAGWPITITGGHCHYFGGEADGPEHLRKKVREAVKWGADYIKIMGSGGGTPGSISWQPAYHLEEMTAIVEEAHSLNRKAIVHCLCAGAIMNAVRARADEVEHAGFLTGQDAPQSFDLESAKMLADASIPVCPTLSVSEFVIESGDPEVKRWQRTKDENLSNAKKLRDLGVSFVAGSDAGWRWSPFDALHAEMQAMAQSGVTPSACIVAATSQAAKRLGLEGVTGMIRAGLSADLVGVRGRPDEDLHSISKVVMVMKEGRRVV